MSERDRLPHTDTGESESVENCGGGRKKHGPIEDPPKSDPSKIGGPPIIPPSANK